MEAPPNLLKREGGTIYKKNIVPKCKRTPFSFYQEFQEFKN
jgi:hypothetical protein